MAEAKTTTTTSPSPAPQKTPPSKPASKALQESAFAEHFGNVLLCLGVLFVAVAVPWSRGFGESGFFIYALHDLIFANELKDFRHSLSGKAAMTESFLGPMLISGAVRPFMMVLDPKLCAAAINYARRLAFLAPYAQEVDEFELFAVKSHILALFLARMATGLLTVVSWSFLRHRLVKRLGLQSVGIWFSLLLVASLMPLLSASALQTSAISSLIINFALGLLLEGHNARAFSLLAVNAACFNIFSGTLTLITAFVCSRILAPRMSLLPALSAVAVTLPLAAALATAFDSLFNGRFVWTQGEHILVLIAQLKEWSLPTKVTSELIRALAPIILLGPLSLTSYQPVSRAALLLGTLPTLAQVLLVKSANDTVHWSVLAVATASAFASNSTAARRSVHKYLGSVLVLALFGGVLFLSASLTFPYAKMSQYGGDAMLSLNRKLLLNAHDGSIQRVYYETEAAAHGTSPFTHLTLNTVIYADEDSVSANFRPDYILAKTSACPDGKKLKSCSGFERLDLKTWQLQQTERLAIYRASQCPQFLSSLVAAKKPADASTVTGTLLSQYLLSGKYTSLKEQRVLIGSTIGRYGYKKAANMIGIVVYLYITVLNQI